MKADLLYLAWYHLQYLLAGSSRTKAPSAPDHLHDFERINERIKTISHKSSTEEKNAFLPIDQMRHHYSSSTESLTLMDFGAGHRTRLHEETKTALGIQRIRSVAEVYRNSSTSPRLGRLMYRLAREWKPTRSLELGTCLGISAAYQLSAMRANNAGELITLEGASPLADMSRLRLAQLDYPHFNIIEGRFADTLGGVLDSSEKYDSVFIDGHHDPDATSGYFEQIYPHLADRAIVIFDDVNWSKGMIGFWIKTKTDTRISAYWDLLKWGICMVCKN